MLILYALSRKEDDGGYVFHSPYYGDGSSSHQHGLCHAADGELLDPLLLTATNRSMFFSEHYYERKKLTVAAFNSLYLGGTAHELGHGLGLPHENGSPSEKPFGTSLMGVGNSTYREELWGGRAPSYIARASALLLASHPLFTRSDRGRWDEPRSGFQSLQFSTNSHTLRIQGAVTSAIPAYAVVAYVWPTTAKTDHRAHAFSCATEGGTFDLNLGGLSSNVWRLKLSRFHVNGAAVSEEFRLHYDNTSTPDAADLNAQWIIGRAEMAFMQRRAEVNEFVDDKALAAAPTPETARQLRVLRTLLHPTTTFDLSTIQDDSAYLSDAVWTDAKVGWGQVVRNHYWFDQRNQNGVFLKLSGQVFEKGLYAHSASRYVFPVNGKWKTFTATIGLRDGAHSQGSAIFTVRGDGSELYRSRILRVEQREEVKVDISGVKELELLTDGGEGHKNSSWAIWAEPKVAR